MVSWLEAPYYLLYEGSLSWNSVQLGDVQAKTQKKEDNVVFYSGGANVKKKKGGGAWSEDLLRHNL